MDAPVVAVRQPGRQPLFVVVDGRLELGRDCDGLLLADAQVSRRHAELRLQGGRLLIADLGSTNGTFVDEVAVTEPVQLRPGTEARLGETLVTLVGAGTTGGGSPSVRATAVTATAVSARGSAGRGPGVPATGGASAAAGTLGGPPGVGPLGPSRAQRSDAPTEAVEDLRRTSIDAVAEDALADPWLPAVELSDGGTLTIVFSDIESSTELATRLGDRAWFAVLGEHNRIVREELVRFGGTEVKCQGDGFMLTFPSARRAVLFAIATQRALARQRAHGVGGMRIRMGMHTGEAIVDRAGDLFGRHVIVAARVANLAQGGEILVSSLVREIVMARGDIHLGPSREVTLKGIDGVHLVYPVDWEVPPAPT